MEEWINQGSEVWAKDVKIKLDEDFCKWASDEVASEVGKHEWQGFLTAAEIDAGEVDAGLRTGMLGGATAGQATAPAAGGIRIEEIIMVMAQGVPALKK